MHNDDAALKRMDGNYTIKRSLTQQVMLNMEEKAEWGQGGRNTEVQN